MKKRVKTSPTDPSSTPWLATQSWNLLCHLPETSSLKQVVAGFARVLETLVIVVEFPLKVVLVPKTQTSLASSKLLRYLRS